MVGAQDSALQYQKPYMFLIIEYCNLNEANLCGVIDGLFVHPVKVFFIADL